MVIIGLWLGVLGYAVLYAGVNKLGGNACTFGQALRGGCQPQAHTNATAPGAGQTVLGAQQATLAQQQAAVPAAPIPVSGFTP